LSASPPSLISLLLLGVGENWINNGKYGSTRNVCSRNDARDDGKMIFMTHSSQFMMHVA
jgi:hypothetical protein